MSFILHRVIAACVLLRLFANAQERLNGSQPTTGDVRSTNGPANLTNIPEPTSSLLANGTTLLNATSSASASATYTTSNTSTIGRNCSFPLRIPGMLTKRRSGDRLRQTVVILLCIQHFGLQAHFGANLHKGRDFHRDGLRNHVHLLLHLWKRMLRRCHDDGDGLLNYHEHPTLHVDSMVNIYWTTAKLHGTVSSMHESMGRVFAVEVRIHVLV